MKPSPRANGSTTTLPAIRPAATAASAATGRNDSLAFVSPRTGRAVSLSAGEPYRDRLLTLPPFLAGEAASDTPRDIVDGLKLTAYFLERHVLAAAGRRLPAARQRLAERLAANVND